MGGRNMWSIDLRWYTILRPGTTSDLVGKDNQCDLADLACGCLRGRMSILPSCGETNPRQVTELAERQFSS
jgi:hypothetical protein